MEPDRESEIIRAVDRGILAFLSVVVLALGLRAIFSHVSYIGQDFQAHRALLLSYPGGFSYYFTNPRGLYWLGALIRNHVSESRYYEILATLFLVLNCAAAWILAELVWLGISRRPLRWAAGVVIFLVPFRQIHSVVLAADAFTVPFFAVAAAFGAALYREPRRAGAWIGLSATLAAGVACKYSIFGAIPPLAVVLGLAIWRQVPAFARLRWFAAGIAALAVPLAIWGHEIAESDRANGYTTHGQWLNKGEPAIMRWRDILFLEENDGQVFAAPEYFRDQVYDTRKFSYPALLYLSTFTDVSNFFQPPPKDFAADRQKREEQFFERNRPPRAALLQRWTMAWCVPLALLAVVGTIHCGVLAALSLFTKKSRLPAGILVAAGMAAGMYGVLVLNFPRLNDPYTPGFWLPRLVMPSVVVFLALGYVTADRLCGRFERGRADLLARLVALHAFVAGALFTAFLW